MRPRPNRRQTRPWIFYRLPLMPPWRWPRRGCCRQSNPPRPVTMCRAALTCCPSTTPSSGRSRRAPLPRAPRLARRWPSRSCWHANGAPRPRPTRCLHGFPRSLRFIPPPSLSLSLPLPLPTKRRIQPLLLPWLAHWPWFGSSAWRKSASAYTSVTTTGFVGMPC